MKKIIIFLLFIATATHSFAQQTKSSMRFTREEYLTKSKNQRTAGRILLIGGGVLIGTAAIIGSNADISFDAAATVAIVAGVGILSAIGSIPLFAASSKNKRRAKAATTSFKFERLPMMQTATAFNYYPAVSLKIRL